MLKLSVTLVLAITIFVIDPCEPDTRVKDLTQVAYGGNVLTFRDAHGVGGYAANFHDGGRGCGNGEKYK